MLGHDTDQDPELHLIVDGAAVQPSVISGRSYRFAVPAGSRVVRLVSRVSVPAEVEPESRDIRRLGVAVERLALYDDNLSIEIRHGHAMLRDGFHEDEASHRWTDGTGRVPDGPVCSFPGEFTLEVSLASCGLLYRAASPADAADAA